MTTRDFIRWAGSRQAQWTVLVIGAITFGIMAVIAYGADEAFWWQFASAAIVCLSIGVPMVGYMDTMKPKPPTLAEQIDQLERACEVGPYARG